MEAKGRVLLISMEANWHFEIITTPRYHGISVNFSPMEEQSNEVLICGMCSIAGILCNYADPCSEINFGTFCYNVHIVPYKIPYYISLGKFRELVNEWKHESSNESTF